MPPFSSLPDLTELEDGVAFPDEQERDDDSPEQPPQEVTCEGGVRLQQLGAGVR